MINGTALSGSLGMILASRPVVPPRKGAFSLYTLIPLNSFFCYLLQEPLWQQRGSTLCEDLLIKNAHVAYNDCATL